MKRMELGSVSLDLVPGPDNPRNSEGAFLTLPDGEILYAYSRYKGKSCSDEATTDLCLLRSRDDGRTFGEESTILTCEGEDGVNAMSLSMMHMETGISDFFTWSGPRIRCCGCSSGDPGTGEEPGGNGCCAHRRKVSLL